MISRQPAAAALVVLGAVLLANPLCVHSHSARGGHVEVTAERTTLVGAAVGDQRYSS